MNLILSRTQIEQLYNLLNQYPDEDAVELLISNKSGIGANITVTIKYAAGTRTDSQDITDHSRW